MAANTMVVSGYIGSVKCDDEGNCIEDNTGQGLMERFADMIEGNPVECTVIFRACYGGSVYDGIPLANAMLAAIQAGIKVTTVIEGIAASMAGFCFLHGQERLIDRLSRWHVHRPQSGCYGTWEDVIAQGENLKSLEADIITRIAERTGKTPEWVATNWCDGPDHELGAADCIKNGVATRIIESTIVPVEADDIEAESPDMLAKKLLPMMQAPKPTEPNKTDIMTPELKAALGLAADATDEQVLAAAAEANKAKTELATMLAAKQAEDKALIEAEVKMLVDADIITKAEAPAITETFMKVGVAGAKQMAAKMKPRQPITQMLATEAAKQGKETEQAKLVNMSVKELDETNSWPKLQAADEHIFQAKYFEKHGKYYKDYKPTK